MQFAVPQFIETEDKIVGPLTLRQFAYLGAAGILIFILFFLVQIWLWFILAAILAAAGAALAFAKVEGRSLPLVVLAALRFFWNPQQYVWQQATAPEIKRGSAEAGENPLEKIVAGFALKNAWRTVQTGSPAPVAAAPRAGKGPERYEIFRGRTGENRVARRIDYR